MTSPLRVLQGGARAPERGDRQLPTIVRAAADGDAAAMRCLVDRFEPVLRSAIRFYRLSPWDADDAIQMTWLQFLQHGRRLREPAAVAGWLMTTARRQCLRVLQVGMRELPTDDLGCGEEAVRADAHQELIAAERRAALLGAFEELPIRSRRLMTLLVATPDLNCEKVGEALDMPVGSIGPTRMRSISRLRRSDRLVALLHEP